jgi:hypothetical protein
MPAADVTGGSFVVEVTNPAPTIGPAQILLHVNGAGICSWVTTYSGDGNYDYLDGVGTAAEWANPSSAVTAKDPVSGNLALFVCDTDNQRIRMIYLQGPNIGQSVTIAGSGVAGYNGPQTPATTGELNFPRGICARNDSSGNLLALYVADTGNSMIRELIPEPPSTWLLGDFPGNGTPGLVDGEGDASQFNEPFAVFTGIDSFIYVADNANAAIRQVDFSGDVLTILQRAGSSPTGITGSSTTHLLYYADAGTQGIYSLTTSGASLTAVAGGTGTAGFNNAVGSAALFNNPREMFWATDTADGEVLYIADAVNARIRKLVISTKTVSTYAGNGTVGLQNGDCTTTEFNRPRCVANGFMGEFYVTDSLNNLIRKVQ